MPPEAGEHLVLYDGTCGLCSRTVRFLVRRDRSALFRFASLQGEAGRAALARAGAGGAGPDSFVLVTGWRSAPAVLYRARAAAFVVACLPWPWRALRVLTVLPWPLLDAAYDLVARHRRRWFPAPVTCAVPGSAERERFLDP